MTYSEVSRVLSPADPGIRDDFRTLFEQERDARKEKDAALAQLRTVGVNINPELRSQIRIDRGDYLLFFENGKLAGWTTK